MDHVHLRGLGFDRAITLRQRRRLRRRERVEVELAALSYAYSKLATELPAAVRQNLENALDIYEVPRTLFVESATKVASGPSDDDYLLPDLKLFPVTQAAEVKYAEQRVLAQITKLDLPHRATACANLVKKADHFGVKLHPEVMKLAGLVVSSTARLQDWLAARSEAVPMNQHLHKVAYEKMAAELKNHPPELRDRAGLLKVAAAIAELDAQAGLVKHYDRRLP